MFSRKPWEPDGGRSLDVESLTVSEITRHMAVAIRLTWDALPEESRTLQEVECRLKSTLREEAERAAVPGYFDDDRLFVRHALQSCANLRPQYMQSAEKLERMVLSALDEELRRARDDQRRNDAGGNPQ